MLECFTHPDIKNDIPLSHLCFFSLGCVYKAQLYISLQFNYILVSVRLHVTGHAPHASHTYAYACNNCSHSQSPMDTHKLECN